MERMETVGNRGNAGEGNTKTPRVVPHKFWAFTLNNWSQEEMETLETSFKKSKIQYIFGEEVGAEGTHHLQGFISHNKKLRPNEKFKNPRIHWEKCIGNKEQNITYCSKSGIIHTNMETLLDPMDNLTLHKWQVEVLEDIKVRPDSRKIIWIWEEDGCTGKTSLAKHICMNNDRAIYVNGKAADVKCCIADMLKKDVHPNVVIFGFPRTSEDYVSYAALEEVKDGIFFSGKFESGMCIFNPPHVIVFANFAPDESKLSKDRWNIRYIGSHIDDSDSDIDYDKKSLSS